MLHISRFEYGRSCGWFARPRGRPSKLFSDGKHGGKQAALKAAVAYRDAEPMPARRPAIRRSEGRVYREERSYRDRKTGKLVYYEAWSVWIRVRGRARHTSYSIAKHGSRAARAMAVAWYRDRLKERAPGLVDVLMTLPAFRGFTV